MISKSITRMGLVLAVAGLFTGPLPAKAARPGKSRTLPSVLREGDPAPALKIGRWVKGTPVQSFQKGEVYVVEFWATWCGPCKQTIPHLTELAKRYEGKATFLGVDVWEKGTQAAIDAKVDAFVSNMGARMDYHVGQDGKNGYMTTAWMKAAGADGIPTAFIVDQAGRVAWIGSPAELEKPLQEILAGTYKIKAKGTTAKAQKAEAAALEAASAARAAEREAADQVLEDVGPSVQKAMEAQNWTGALALVEEAEAKHRDLPTLQKLFHLRGLHVRILTHIDPAKAQALMESTLTPPTLSGYQIAFFFVLNQLREGDPRWSQLGLSYLDKACALDATFEQKFKAVRFGLLLRVDEVQAKALLEAEKAKLDNTQAIEMVDQILKLEGVAQSWLEAAVSVLEPIKKDPKDGHTLAKIYFRLGRAKEALPLQEQFLAYLKGEGADQDMLSEFEKELQTYQTAAGAHSSSEAK